MVVFLAAGLTGYFLVETRVRRAKAAHNARVQTEKE
jgi:hypothetical protein